MYDQTHIEDGETQRARRQLTVAEAQILHARLPHWREHTERLLAEAVAAEGGLAPIAPETIVLAAPALTAEQEQFLNVRLTDMQEQCNRLLAEKRAAEERARHAQRLTVAVEMRLDGLDEQCSELLVALGKLADSVHHLAVSGLIQRAWSRADALLQRYARDEVFE